MNYSKGHSFHIPVMGLAYTIDSPVKVAHYGISSVISIVEDKLVEMMRAHYYRKMQRTFVPIEPAETDFRAKRITDYLNLVQEMVQDNFEKLKQAAFEKGSEIVKYFEMLPEHSMLKKLYLQMQEAVDGNEKAKLQEVLRNNLETGHIDVNIMTKLDRNAYDAKGEVIEDGSEAVAALRGFANSNLHNAAVVFSAGMNPRLFNYVENCPAFSPNEEGKFDKKIIIKVSDYRSALIQGKFLAKKGVWVSEFRVESGLNCGGHAFATEGYLFGPILEEFRQNWQQLTTELFDIYKAAILKKTGKELTVVPFIGFTAQGGIGTYKEDELLRTHYGVQSTGWGTPFLLVPEATTVDDNTLEQLCAATESDLSLSYNSPLGIRFNYLHGTTGEKQKGDRVRRGKPGTPCTEKHLAFNTEFTKEPICTASHKYQKLKLAQLAGMELSEVEYEQQVTDVLAKECLCVGLSNAAAIKYDTELVKGRKEVNICPGPNIANFSQVVSLQQMADHIYGRGNVMTNPNRVHMFITEIDMYIDYLKEQISKDVQKGELEKRKKYYTTFCRNMKQGIAYYQALDINDTAASASFQKALENALLEIDILNYRYEINAFAA